MTMTFSLLAIGLAVALVAVGLVWIGVLQRCQPGDQKASLPTISLIPVALVVIGGGILALQIFADDPLAGRQ